jgi:hypothetical protein
LLNEIAKLNKDDNNKKSAWLFSIRIENEELGKCLILTDSMSSIMAMESRKISLHTHQFVYECRQKCWQLTQSGREVSFMWVPAHEARQATLGNMVYNAQSVGRDLIPIAQQRMLDEWQKSWEVAETGRFSHSIFPRVSLRPWFEEWRSGSKLKTTVSRIISGPT